MRARGCAGPARAATPPPPFTGMNKSFGVWRRGGAPDSAGERRRDATGAATPCRATAITALLMAATPLVYLRASAATSTRAAPVARFMKWRRLGRSPREI